jgi:hypothetical protein
MYHIVSHGTNLRKHVSANTIQFSTSTTAEPHVSAPVGKKKEKTVPKIKIEYA